MIDDTQHITPEFYYDRNFDIEATKILPGDYFATSRDVMIVTVLGSCVAACIFDPHLGIGGMNHFMLPHISARDPEPISAANRYGAHAMEILINQLLKMGAERSRLKLKLFGGCQVIQSFSAIDIGERNARFAWHYAQTEQLEVLAHDFGGEHPRKVYFFPRSGKVLVKRLRTLHNDTIYRREQEYESRLQREKLSGDVELFC